jgi:hypothetical protein
LRENKIALILDGEYPKGAFRLRRLLMKSRGQSEERDFLHQREYTEGFS